MKKQHLIFALLLTLSSCSNKIQGILINPNDYLSTNGMMEIFSTQTAFRGNLPAAILTDKKEVYYISIPSNKFEKFAGEPIKIQGQIVKEAHIVKPSKAWYKIKNNWNLIKL